MKISNNFKTGLFVLIAIGFLAALLFKTDAFKSNKKGYSIYTRFGFANGIEINAPVRFSGVEVGRVININLEKTEAVLTLLIDEGVKVLAGDKIYINTLGLMGEKYVEIIHGDLNSEVLNPGDTIRGQEPVQMEMLLKKGEEIANEINLAVKDVRVLTNNINGLVDTNKESVNTIFANLEETTTDVKGLIKDTKEPLTNTIKSAESATGHLDDILSENKDEVTRIVANAETVSENFVDFSEDVKNNPWKLLFKGKEKKSK